MNLLFINGRTFKQYRDTKYYCDEDGNIYSDYSHRIITPMRRGKENKKYPYIDINFGEGQKHCYIHKIVFETWIGNIPDGYLVLHKDDNQENNNINNLYLGNQKENIKDCENNRHRVGNTWILTVYDKEKEKTLSFCPASNFIEYCQHSSKNGGITKMFNKNWFKKRYEIIDYRKCVSIEEKEGVTTNGR